MRESISGEARKGFQMAKRRYREEEIIATLRLDDVELGKGQ